MSNNKTNLLDLLNFLNLYKIEIPSFQREYAQGRIGREHVRAGFLLDIKNSLDKKEPLHLDYIFGFCKKSESGDDIFVPIDGQQRLTTLWLIYWYIAFVSKNIENNKENNKKILKKFSYELREKTKMFCEYLIEMNAENYNKENESLYEHIAKQTWFMNDWLQDPTIQSMLRMIDNQYTGNDEIDDCIVKVFKNCNEEDYKKYYELLYNKKMLITFNCEINDSLNIDSYVKMNARGIELTNFEKFKADFVGKVGEYEFNSKKISSLIDGDWADIFWTKIDKETDRPKELDNIYYRWMNEIYCAFFSYIKFNNKDESKNEYFKEKINKFINYTNTDQEHFVYNNYEIYEFEGLNYNELAQFIYVALEYISRISRIGKYGDFVKACEPMWDNKDTFKYIGYKEKKEYAALTLKDKLKFLAISLFFYKNYEHKKENIDLSKFRHWMIFVNDFLENVHSIDFEVYYGLIDDICKTSNELISEDYFKNDEKYIYNWLKQNLIECVKDKAKNIIINKVKDCNNDDIYNLIYGEKGLNSWQFYRGNLNLFLNNLGENNKKELIEKRRNIFNDAFVEDDNNHAKIDPKCNVHKNNMLYKCILASYDTFDELKNESMFPLIGVDHGHNRVLQVLSDETRMKKIHKVIDEYEWDKDEKENNISKALEVLIDEKNIWDANIKNIINKKDIYKWINGENKHSTLARIASYDGKFKIHINRAQKDEHYFCLDIKEEGYITANEVLFDEVFKKIELTINTTFEKKYDNVARKEFCKERFFTTGKTYKKIPLFIGLGTYHSEKKEEDNGFYIGLCFIENHKKESTEIKNQYFASGNGKSNDNWSYYTIIDNNLFFDKWDNIAKLIDKTNMDDLVNKVVIEYNEIMNAIEKIE